MRRDPSPYAGAPVSDPEAASTSASESASGTASASGTSPAGRSTAGILLPPPVYPLVVIGIAEALHRWRPISLPGLGGDGWRLGLALALFACALALAAGALLVMRRARTPVEPWKRTRAIVSSGPFAISRNPIYLAFLGVQLAYAWGRPNGWGILLLPVTGALLYVAVIRKEEVYLDRLFGAEYARYRRAVRRWL